MFAELHILMKCLMAVWLKGEIMRKFVKNEHLVYRVSKQDVHRLWNKGLKGPHGPNSYSISGATFCLLTRYKFDWLHAMLMMLMHLIEYWTCPPDVGFVIYFLPRNIDVLPSLYLLLPHSPPTRPPRSCGLQGANKDNQTMDAQDSLKERSLSSTPNSGYMDHVCPG